MKTIISIGEALIDFVPNEKGVNLKDIVNFSRVAGGAPLNVAATVAKLGGRSKIITKLGKDSFGEHILEEVKSIGVDISSVLRTKEANTALAFVSLKENGERDFSFYRKPSADMLLKDDEINEKQFYDLKNDGILHFCSVSLIDAPIKYAHIKAIQLAKKHNFLISFDPNVRLPLWDSSQDCRNAIWEFLPYADILKISDEELEFITGIKNEDDAISSLFKGNVKVVIYTKGGEGAEFITKDKKIKSKSFKVTPKDTTGAGDSFIGSFLYSLSKENITKDNLIYLDNGKIEDILNFCNATASITVSKKGAIAALPTKEEVLKKLEEK